MARGHVGLARARRLRARAAVADVARDRARHVSRRIHTLLVARGPSLAEPAALARVVGASVPARGRPAEHDPGRDSRVLGEGDLSDLRLGAAPLRPDRTRRSGARRRPHVGAGLPRVSAARGGGGVATPLAGNRRTPCTFTCPRTRTPALPDCRVRSRAASRLRSAPYARHRRAPALAVRSARAASHPLRARGPRRRGGIHGAAGRCGEPGHGDRLDLGEGDCGDRPPRGRQPLLHGLSLHFPARAREEARPRPARLSGGAALEVARGGPHRSVLLGLRGVRSLGSAGRDGRDRRRLLRRGLPGRRGLSRSQLLQIHLPDRTVPVRGLARLTAGGQGAAAGGLRRLHDARLPARERRHGAAGLRARALPADEVGKPRLHVLPRLREGVSPRQRGSPSGPSGGGAASGSSPLLGRPVRAAARSRRDRARAPRRGVRGGGGDGFALRRERLLERAPRGGVLRRGARGGRHARRRRLGRRKSLGRRLREATSRRSSAARR